MKLSELKRKLFQIENESCGSGFTADDPEVHVCVGSYIVPVKSIRFSEKVVEDLNNSGILLLAD